MINRDNALALMPDDVSTDILNGVRQSSTFMKLAKKLPNMSTGVRSQPVLSALPMADFVNGDSGLKSVSKAEWAKKNLVAGEIAVIIPVPDAIIDDSSYDIWEQIKPLAVESISRVLDNQVFNGGNPKAPSEWPEAIIPAAIAKGNTISVGDGTDVAEDISNAMGILENVNYDVTGIAAQPALKSGLRNMRTTTGEPIFTPPTAVSPSTVYGVGTEFVSAGVWDKADATAILGDWTKAVYAMRQDITYKVFEEGVVTDEDGKVVYNLMQQDMKAMRIVMRVAWQIADTIDIDRPYESSYPFALLTPGTPTGGK